MRPAPSALLGVGLLAAAPAPAQTLNVGSFDLSRAVRPLTGGGPFEHQHLLAALTDPANFGPVGTVPCSVTIAAPTGTISAAYLADKQVFYTSNFHTNLSPTEAAALQAWHAAGGSIVVQADTDTGSGPPHSLMQAIGATTTFGAPGCPNSPNGGLITESLGPAAAGPFGDLRGATFATTVGQALNMNGEPRSLIVCTDSRHAMACLAPGQVNGTTSGSVVLCADPCFSDLLCDPTSGYYNPSNLTLALNLFAAFCEGGTWGVHYKCFQGVTNSLGLVAEIGAGGSNLSGGQPFTLCTTGLPEGEFGYYVTSQTQGFVTGPGGSQGNLCLGGNIGRFSAQVGPAVGGSFCIAVDTTGMPTNPNEPVLAGQTWSFQLWYRDKNPGPTSNFSNAIAVMFR